MAKDSKFRQPTRLLGGEPHVNIMPSGLIHCADSQGHPGRIGQVIIQFGEPGSPLEQSAGIQGDAGAGTSPNLLRKFSHEKQS
jgi:hypothetical protein